MTVSADIVAAGAPIVASTRDLAVAIDGAKSSAITVTTVPQTSTTSTVTRAATNIVNTTLLALNTARKGFTLYNNSTLSNLFMKLGATANIGAGTESYTVRIVPGAYYEVPFNYTGRVDGIWDAADANGEVLIDELT